MVLYWASKYRPLAFRIIDQKIDFYYSVTKGCKNDILVALESKGIKILDGFIKNVSLVREFYKTYYNSDNKRVVLCGINPGRFGAGKTGLPFLDFKSLSNLMEFVNNSDSEQSAQFIYSIISHYGPKRFFDSIYLTNISWFGFTNGNKNFNYYKLPYDLQKEFINGFISEMEIVQPVKIIPLGEKVEKSLIMMKKTGKMKYNIAKALNHPYYCSIGKNKDQSLNNYITILNNYINT